MNKTIVVYYSRKGSNKFLANKIATTLGCEIEEIKPRLNVFLLFLMNVHAGIKPLKHNINEYNKVILCGPIWMGKLIPPLRSFIEKYSKNISKLIFVTCCGSTFEQRDEKFGHSLVFEKVKNIVSQKCVHCEAFPIGIVLPVSHREDTDAFMKTHLSDENFKGEIQERFKAFIQKMYEL